MARRRHRHSAAFSYCLAAASAFLLMGLYGEVGLAPGMGLNAFFTTTVVGTAGLQLADRPRRGVPSPG